MRVVIGSIFRNSTSYLKRYFDQVDSLVHEIHKRGDTVYLVLAEGDSDDRTYEAIIKNLCDRGYQSNSTCLKVDHGGRAFGSIDHDERWRNISMVCNQLLCFVPICDKMIYVESDLIWEAETMLKLLDAVGPGDTDFDAVAPMCFHKPTGNFYDTWGHRANGVRFTPTFPYHQNIPYGALDFEDHAYIPIDSAGSCLVMRGGIPLVCRFTPPERGIVGFCEDFARHGYDLWLDPNCSVLHP